MKWAERESCHTDGHLIFPMSSIQNTQKKKKKTLQLHHHRLILLQVIASVSFILSFCIFHFWLNNDLATFVPGLSISFFMFISRYSFNYSMQYMYAFISLIFVL